jgi:hypothetical protein
MRALHTRSDGLAGGRPDQKAPTGLTPKTASATITWAVWACLIPTARTVGSTCRQDMWAAHGDVRSFLDRPAGVPAQRGTCTGPHTGVWLTPVTPSSATGRPVRPTPGWWNVGPGKGGQPRTEEAAPRQVTPGPTRRPSPDAHEADMSNTRNVQAPRRTGIPGHKAPVGADAEDRERNDDQCDEHHDHQRRRDQHHEVLRTG